MMRVSKTLKSQKFNEHASDKLLPVIRYPSPEFASTLYNVAPFIPRQVRIMAQESVRQNSTNRGQRRVRVGIWYQSYQARSNVAFKADQQRNLMRPYVLPIEGPPNTRIISLDEPPSSEIGST